MQEFFTLEPGIFHFSVLNWIHILITLILIIGILLIYFNKEKLRNIKNLDKIFRYTTAGLMFLNMKVYYIAALLDGTYTYKEHLPLHFCFMSGYFFMYILITNNKKMFKYAYFFSFIGPLPAILLPDIICGFDRFIFYQFFISHHIYLLASLYCLFVLKWTVTKIDVIKSFVIANIYFVLVLIFNIIFETNYIMTTELPPHIPELFPFVKYFNYPIVWLYLAGIVAIIIACIPIKLMNKEKNK